MLSETPELKYVAVVMNNFTSLTYRPPISTAHQVGFAYEHCIRAYRFAALCHEASVKLKGLQLLHMRFTKTNTGSFEQTREFRD